MHRAADGNCRLRQLKTSHVEQRVEGNFWSPICLTLFCLQVSGRHRLRHRWQGGYVAYRHALTNLRNVSGRDGVPVDVWQRFQVDRGDRSD